MPTLITTATTDMVDRMANARSNVVYVNDPPRGHVYTVTPNPPTPRDWRPEPR